MMYDSKGINEVYDYLRSNSGAVGYDEILTAPPTRAVDETKTVYNYQYVLETDTKGRYTKEWQTKLVGTIYMNGNTGLIKRAGTPTIYLTYTNFGASFSPYMSSVSTHSSSTSSYATFSATYHMYATLSISIGDLPLGYTLDFKQHTHSFTSNQRYAGYEKENYSCSGGNCHCICRCSFCKIQYEDDSDIAVSDTSDNNKDVTEEFKNKHLTDYQNKDYKAIWNDVRDRYSFSGTDLPGKNS